jgi:hypothetical protein
VSRLRRDRKALKTARFVARYEPDDRYTGTGRWGWASYRAIAWMVQRQVRATMDDPRSERQVYHVYRAFGVEMREL